MLRFIKQQGYACVTDLRGQPRSEEHRLNSSHLVISYAVFCLKKKKKKANNSTSPIHHYMIALTRVISHTFERSSLHIIRHTILLLPFCMILHGALHVHRVLTQ